MNNACSEKVAAAAAALEAVLLAAWPDRPENAEVRIVMWDNQESGWGPRVAEISLGMGAAGSSFFQVDAAGDGLKACALAERAILMRAFGGEEFQLGFDAEDLQSVEAALTVLCFGDAEDAHVSLLLDVHTANRDEALPFDYVRVSLTPEVLGQIEEAAALARKPGIVGINLGAIATVEPLHIDYQGTESSPPVAFAEDDDDAPRLDAVSLTVTKDHLTWRGGIRHHDGSSDWFTSRVSRQSILGVTGLLDLRE